MTNNEVYLDHNASAPLLPQAHDAMLSAMALCGNPSSVHAHGRALRQIIEMARSQVAALSGAEREQVVFTGSATEAITQAIIGSARHFSLDRILVSAGEHVAVLEAAKTSGAKTEIIPLAQNGEIDVAVLKTLLKAADEANESVLVAIHMLNSETGTIQPVGEIEALVGPSRHFLFVDAVQALGKLNIGFASSAADMMALSAHKIGGPAGIGALLVKAHCNEVRLIPGGGQEGGRRGGTQSAMLIAGFGAAAQNFAGRFDIERLKLLRDGFERQLAEFFPEMVVFGQEGERVGSVSYFALPGIKSPVLMMALDLESISISNGSACSSGKVGQSRVLEAMAVDDEIADCAIRVSLGWNTTQDDINRLVEAIRQICARQKSRLAPDRR
ncbi:Cysteine desulfurase [hydrothermal vent metagenome]|uniref:Cysteine desulfurase n=1 Tax=hydrothermal vent metagenome TaxID=652676 RepID=A0A3B0UKG3_9ZZZZ